MRPEAAQANVNGIGKPRSGVKHMSRVKNTAAALSAEEKTYLSMGLMQAGGKLPLFDTSGQEIRRAIIQSCLKKGYAETWFANPLKPDWLVCRLTEEGRKLAQFG